VTRRRRYLALAGGCLVVFLTLDAGLPAALAAVLGVLGVVCWAAGP
jgi:hypothetical protein